ncbi:MAG: MFS transporter [Proteobacteria bacterium]|nr:MFS transporter [Pseudomonadota bacterium]
MNPADAPHSRRWIWLSGLWVIYAAFGLISGGLAPLVAEIGGELGLSRAALGSVMGAWPLVYIASALPAGLAVDRWGVRRALIWGALCVAASSGLRALAWDHLSLFAAVALFGLGGPLISIGAPKLIGARFPQDERGLALGLYTTGPAVGHMAALGATQAWVLPWLGGWRQGLAFYALLALAAAALWGVVSRDLEASSAPPPGPGAEERIAVPDLLRTPGVPLCLALGVGCFLYAHGLTGWLPEILRSGGMTPTRAGWAAAFATGVGVPAAILIPRLALPPRRAYLLSATFACGSAAAVLLLAGVWWPALVLLGLARACLVPILVLALIESPGLRAAQVGAASGLFFSFAEAGGVAGPLLLGLLADFSGGFLPPLAAFGGLALALSALSLALPRPPRPYAKLAPRREERSA